MSIPYPIRIEENELVDVVVNYLSPGNLVGFIIKLDKSASDTLVTKLLYEYFKEQHTRDMINEMEESANADSYNE